MRVLFLRRFTWEFCCSFLHRVLQGFYFGWPDRNAERAIIAGSHGNSFVCVCTWTPKIRNWWARQRCQACRHRLKAENVSANRLNSLADEQQNGRPASPRLAHLALPRSAPPSTPCPARWISGFWTRQVKCLTLLGPMEYNFAWNLCLSSGG